MVQRPATKSYFIITARQRRADDVVPRASVNSSSSLGITWHLLSLASYLTANIPAVAADGTDNDDENLDELDYSGPPFDFIGLIAFVVAVAALVYAALKLAGRGDMFGESGYLAEQERLAREEAARAAEEEKAKETEYQLK